MCIEVAGSQEKQCEDKIIKTIEGRIMRDMKNFFEQEEDYYKPVR